ncbi:MAG: HK97 family phage prohead protease [Parvibaculum sp.]|uniref:HK97 family phage prohead protease n=1 Tax=Parvibaculum sp. TaxID=2024848 RepID=UPI002AB934DE|nr:HK97 family phage prohead protease [Parvibaculum sp.]MDZ4382815.1 HK97 family phage prohead protease [Parvibaculum sp.]
MKIFQSKSARSLRVADFNFDIKALAENGKFTGYGSVFGVVDSYQEIVAPGAFTETLAERAATKRRLPVLWQHRSAEPLGYYEKVQEDERGLYLEGFVLKDKISRAAEAYALMEAGVVTGLSIGYWVRESSYDEKTGIRTLTKLDLEEVSLVTFPANDEARVEAVKFKLAHGALPTLREFERVLRDEGFSHAQAKAIASQGYRSLLQRDAAGAEGENDEGLKASLSELLTAAKLDLSSLS